MAKAKTQEKNVDDVFEKLEAKFGKNVFLRARDAEKDVSNWTSTGSLTLDIAIGGKGVPKDGRTTCILGKESSSKTTLSLHIIAEEQKKGGLCAFLDVEDSLSTSYAEKIGVDLDKLHLVDGQSLLKSLGVKDRTAVAGEEWLELTCKILEANIYDLIVLDSVAALIPLAEIANGIAGGRLAGVASMMSKAYRAMNAALSVSKTGFVYLNQYRMNPGGYVPLVEPGGEAWKYLQDLKLEIFRSQDKDSEGSTQGLKIKGKVTKSKVGMPYNQFEYYLNLGEGIDKIKEIIGLSVESGAIEKGGPWYTVNGTKIQGEASVKQFLLDNPEYCLELENKIRGI